jgi:hypothetical protein
MKISGRKSLASEASGQRLFLGKRFAWRQFGINAGFTSAVHAGAVLILGGGGGKATQNKSCPCMNQEAQSIFVSGIFKAAPYSIMFILIIEPQPELEPRDWAVPIPRHLS